MTGATTPPNNDFLGTLLRDQQDLSAASRFAVWHDQSHGSTVSQQYRALVPLTAPGPGEQYAFEVDLDVCSGCKACVTACHSLNGLDEHETWRSVGLLQSAELGLPVLKHVTTACHHCVEPACLGGCPTLAYEKDAVTGIVRHLDDQCFGCQYCILMCPYEVPTYSPSRGIVRKCDMCRQRLSEHELPACVQGCPNSAIAIRIVSQQAMVEKAASGEFLPTAPSPTLTKPSTTYRGNIVEPKQLVAGDHDRFHAAHAHWPLVFMLVLTQMSVGILAVSHALIYWLQWLPAEPSRAVLNVAAATIGFLGANLALLHLGRPLQAYRAWLGWRTSWLSREVIAFGAYVPLVGTAAVAVFVPTMVSPALQTVIELAAIASGVVAVYCSAMIYIATRRPWWSRSLTLRRFGITMFSLGNASCMVVAAALAAMKDGNSPWWDYRFLLATLSVATVVTLARYGLERRWLASAINSPEPTIRGCAKIIRGELLHVARGMQVAAFLNAIVIPSMILLLLQADPALGRHIITAICVTRLAITLGAEIADRYLFFAASVSPRMPGAPQP